MATNKETATALLLAVAMAAAAALTCHAARTTGGVDPQGNKKKDDCHLSDIAVSLVKTGKVVEGQPQYQVTVDNRCICPQFDIKLRCLGLRSVEPVDRSKIVPVGDGELCLVAAGTLVFHETPVVFTYAWKTPQSFDLVSATPKCELDG